MGKQQIHIVNKYLKKIIIEHVQKNTRSKCIKSQKT